MALFRRHSPPGRLFFSRADGRSLRRELPPGLLEKFVERVVQPDDAVVQASWKAAGQAGSAAVLTRWPATLPRPERALLGEGDGKERGPWLEATFARGVALQEVADDFQRWLEGRAPLERVHAEPVAAAAPPTPRPGAPPAVASPAGAEASVHAPAPEPSSAAPEVIAPGARLAAPRSRQFRARPDDLFALFGPQHPEDLLDPGLEVRVEDIPWLNPGDRLYSPRRGSCRVLRAEDERGRVVLRDDRGREVAVPHAELTAEFCFDEDDNTSASGV